MKARNKKDFSRVYPEPDEGVEMTETTVYERP